MTLKKMPNKAVNPSGRSGVFTNQRFLAAAGLPLSFCRLIMTSELPFPIESVGWNNLSEADRDFFCFQDEYVPLPSDHAAQIQRLTPVVARRIWKWLGPSLPPGWPESEPHFANEATLRLGDRDWNTDEVYELSANGSTIAGFPIRLTSSSCMKPIGLFGCHGSCL